MHSRLPLLVVAFALPAFATAEFPGAIQTHLSLGAPPAQSCSLCHTNGITGAGTVNTPIGRALRMQGMVASDTASLIVALDALEAAGTDSDMDGVGDVAELRAGTNPNVAEAPADGGMGGGAGGGAGGGGGGEPEVIPPPKFGCGGAVAPGLAVVAALGLLQRRRRR
jgi:hypothetical protein